MSLVSKFKFIVVLNCKCNSKVLHRILFEKDNLKVIGCKNLKQCEIENSEKMDPIKIIQKKIDAIIPFPDYKIPYLPSLLNRIRPHHEIFNHKFFFKKLLKNIDPTHVEHLEHVIDLFEKLAELMHELLKPKENLISIVSNSFFEKLPAQNNISNVNISDLNDIVYLTIDTKKQNFSMIPFHFLNILNKINQKIIDVNFDREESKFHCIEKSIKEFYLNINNQINCIKNYSNQENILLNDMQMLIFKEEFRSNESNKNLQLNIYVENLTKSVLDPLNILLSYFTRIKSLIEKRRLSLFDYEAALLEYFIKAPDSIKSIVEQLRDKMNLTKINYETLNSQLIEELPIMSKKSYNLLMKCVKYYLSQTNHLFHLNKHELCHQIESKRFNFVLENCKINERLELKNIMIACMTADCEAKYSD